MECPMSVYSMRTGAVVRSTARGYAEPANALAGQWQRTYTLDKVSLGENHDVQPIDGADAHGRWPEAVELVSKATT